MTAARLGGWNGEGQEGGGRSSRKEAQHNFESEIEEDTQRGRDIHPERPSVVDRDKDRVGEGKEGRQVFELAANSANP